MIDMNEDHSTDALTGLFNARHAMSELRRVIYSSEYHRNRSVAVIFTDIFQLKTPHDFYGHQPVDDLLLSAAAHLRQTKAR